MEPKIIFEDDSLLVIDKPAGWIVNEASTTTTQPVIQTWLKENYSYPLIGNYDCRDGVVHRLDKETSGVLLVAKTQEAFNELQRQFKEREIEKDYTALVHGKLDQKRGDVDVPVGRLPWRRDRFGVMPGGRPSKTIYEVVGEYIDGKSEYSLVKAHPKTGRTHQIRIHFKYLGHALVSDEFYAGRKTARNDRKFCSRLFLHASGITFNHPVTKKNVSFTSELPEDLQKVLSSLTRI